MNFLVNLTFRLRIIFLEECVPIYIALFEKLKILSHSFHDTNIKFTAAFLKTFATLASFGIGRFLKNKIVTAFAAYFILSRKRAGVGIFILKFVFKQTFCFYLSLVEYPARLS